MNPLFWIPSIIAMGLLLLAARAHRLRRQAERTAEDLQEQLRRVRHELLASREQTGAERQTLFNNMIEGVMILDPFERIVLVNRSLEEQFDLRLDVRGVKVHDAFKRPELDLVMAQIRKATSAMEIEIELPGPPMRLLDVTAAPVLDRESRPAGTVLVFHDLTRTRELENTRREFVANVSHELRTPLSLIRGYVETLQDGALANPLKAARFVEIIERQTRRLTKLIEDILTISHIESGAIRLQLQDFDLADLSHEVLTQLEPKAAARQTRLISGIPKGAQVHADRDRVEQVLVNLVENAIKYGRTEGTVRVTSRTLEEGRLEMSVTDDGPGIPVEVGERVFERFYRVDKARSRETGGTGLGLAIVKHIMQSHGGEVGLESFSGAGSRFWVRFPAPQNTRAAGEGEVEGEGS